MEALWDSILELTARFVIPDWGAVIGLLPAVLLVLVAVYLVWTAWRFAHAGPTRRVPARRVPVTPAGIHMPGPSIAPFLGAFGAFALLAGLVYGGNWLWVGVAALVLGLLYWGREGLADFDHVVAAERLPAVVHPGPPPGVHVPGPSFRPFMAALAMTMLLFGLVFGGWLLAAGAIFFVVSLLGWLYDARREYVKTTEADRTGHLENIPAPGWPRRVLVTFALVVAIALLIDAGVLFSSPSPDGAAGGGGGGGGAPEACAEPSSDPELVAVNIAFDVTELCVPADTAFTIHLVNDDPAGVTHDVDLRAGDGSVIADTTPVDGGADATYEYEALTAGEYVFICSIHPIPPMTGTLVVQ
jgi:hypothetical protein